MPLGAARFGFQSGAYNVALGSGALCDIDSGEGNIGVGRCAGMKNATGSDNTFMGKYAGCDGTNGSHNFFVGNSAGRCKVGAGNIIIGEEAGRGSSTTTNNTGNYNIFLGKSAGFDITSGCCNISLGRESGANITSGNDNVLLGGNAGCSIVDSHRNILIGKCAGMSVTSSDNVMIGLRAGECSGASEYNVFIGRDAGRAVGTGGDGDNNTFVGYLAGCNVTTGSCNVAIGNMALRSDGGGVTGDYNIAMGDCAGNAVTSGHSNIIIGCKSGCTATTAQENIFIGNKAGRDTSTAAKKNLFLGDLAGHTNTTGSCNIAIGREVTLASATGTNQLAIGDGSNRWITGDSSFNVTVSTASTFSSGGLNVTGVVTATSFAGDGSALTGIAAGGSGEFNTGITSTVQATPLSFETTMHTFPSTSGRQYVIESINVANVDESVGVGTTVNIIASIQDATAGEQTYIAYNVPIVTGGTIELLKNPIVAGPSDVIRMWTTSDAYVGVNNAADVYINYAEHESTDFISKFAATTTINSTDAITLYTSTSNPTMIEKIGFANRTDTGDFPISIKVTSGTTTSYLAKNLIIPRYSTVDILDRPKRIETNAKIEVEVGSTSTIDVIIAGKKITS